MVYRGRSVHTLLYMCPRASSRIVHSNTSQLWTDTCSFDAELVNRSSDPERGRANGIGSVMIEAGSLHSVHGNAYSSVPGVPELKSTSLLERGFNIAPRVTEERMYIALSNLLLHLATSRTRYNLSTSEPSGHREQKNACRRDRAVRTVT
ncbi:hypothetical protein DENSPDRAFT_33297 [Dentipellis sp. KUC8613]|nr:hypothetical protein DENSPDRAFT_33297 [Dentipellis sp. KUC8613]